MSATKLESNSGRMDDEAKVDPFFWTYTEEPHKSRRQAIIKAHPEVLKLCGPDSTTAVVVLALGLIQLCCAYSLRDTPVLSWRFFLTAYIIGATSNQNIYLLNHEMSHNLVFKSSFANRMLELFSNLPIALPYTALFRPYHLTHHKSLGVDGFDSDLPTALEARLLDSVAGKIFFCIFQLCFYAGRPLFTYKIPMTWFHLTNIVLYISFDLALIYFIGVRSLLYLLISSFLAGSLHPCAAHFIAEHYIFPQYHHSQTGTRADPAGRSFLVSDAKPVETYSYYGSLNYITCNVGLHNEHHDFPAIPWTRLWKLNAIANEFYRDLPCTYSWFGVLYHFIVRDDVGLWCRIKRKEGGRRVDGARTGWMD